jgi:hypothetical protein
MGSNLVMRQNGGGSTLNIYVARGGLILHGSALR